MKSAGSFRLLTITNDIRSISVKRLRFVFLLFVFFFLTFFCVQIFAFSPMEYPFFFIQYMCIIPFELVNCRKKPESQFLLLILPCICSIYIII